MISTSYIKLHDGPEYHATVASEPTDVYSPMMAGGGFVASQPGAGPGEEMYSPMTSMTPSSAVYGNVDAATALATPGL